MALVVLPPHDTKRVSVVENLSVLAGPMFETRTGVRSEMHGHLVRVDHPRIIDNHRPRYFSLVEIAFHGGIGGPLVEPRPPLLVTLEKCGAPRSDP